MIVGVYIVGLCYIAFIIAIIVGSLDNMNADDIIKIKFNSFISFYNINPNRWELNDSTVFFRTKQKSYPYSSDYQYTKFKFNLIDTIKYKHWKRQKSKNDKILKDCEEYQKVLEIIKQDIQATQQESVRLSNDGLDILRNVANK